MQLLSACASLGVNSPDLTSVAQDGLDQAVKELALKSRIAYVDVRSASA